ncbi:uncharacterized protein LOC131857528 [Cryptomeria japonica]|uniref:uncharacterized protein LOC131857528 n=1 Tax=Cryptomeria japonica TaxID=3369 RepID=UPI0027D9F9AC|nr:uncharacterized protein LOC131857528 [Cryptomeria japonica]
MTNKKADSSTSEGNQKKDATELMNEVKRTESSSNDKQDCVCSNDPPESSKEAEPRTELINKENPEAQENETVSQEKEETILDQEDESTSQEKEESYPVFSLSKSAEVNFNEAQDPSDTEPLLLLTNGSPKPLLCKTPSQSVHMLDEILRIPGSREGKSNKEELNGGISTRSSKIKKKPDVGSQNKK